MRARPRQVFAIGVNYRDHAAEAGIDLPAEPMVFTKYPSAITGPYQFGSTPIHLDPSNATATADKLATRANALFWLVVGVDYIVRGDVTTER